jgi:hypothetical protein
METAVRLDINLTIVVLNDNGFGMIKWKQNAAGYSMLVPLHSLFLVSTWNHHADYDSDSGGPHVQYKTKNGQPAAVPKGNANVFFSVIEVGNLWRCLRHITGPRRLCI